MSKNKLGMLAMLGAVLATDQKESITIGTETNGRKKPKVDPEVQEYKIKTSNGLSIFHYGGNRLWALNQKSADRKAMRRGWL